MKQVALLTLVAVLTGCDKEPLPPDPVTPRGRASDEAGIEAIAPGLPHLKTVDAPSQVYCLAYSNDGRRIASGQIGKSISIWDAETGKLKQTIGPDVTVRSLAFSPDDKRLAATGWAGSEAGVAVWDIDSGEKLQEFSLQFGSGSKVEFSADGRRLAAADESYTKVWNLDTGDEEFMIEGKYPVFSSGNRKLFSSGWKSGLKTNEWGVKVWDATGNELAVMHGLPDPVAAVAISHDGLRIAAGSSAGMIKVWEAETRKELLTTGYEKPGRVSSVCFSPDARWLVSVCGSTFTIWDTNSGVEYATIEGKPRGFLLSAAEFSPDGKTLAVASSANVLLLWDAAPLLAKD